ncbi:hypothetical protein D9M73_293650 [compost metagenome]
MAEAAPVVDDLQALAVGGDEGQLLHTLLVDDRRRDALRIQRAGGVELATVDAKAISVAAQ